MEQEELNNIFEVLDELIAGKYINIKNVLIKYDRAVKNNSKLCEILKDISSCNNFDRELEIAQVRSPNKPGKFVLPREDEKIVLLVNQLLSDIGLGRLNFDFFLNTYFVDENISQNKKFGEELIAPYKKSLKNCYEGKVYYSKLTNNKEKKVNEKEEQYFVDIEKVAEEMLEVLNMERKIKDDLKEDSVYLLNALIYAAKQKNLKYVNALIIAFSYMLEKVKCLHFYSLELKQRMAEYYSL